MATEAPPIGPGFDLYVSQSGRLKRSNIALIILPTIFVLLRLASRKVSRAGYWYDDLLVLLALIFSYGLPICNLISTVSYGFGRHIYILPLDTTPQFLKILYVFELFFYLTAGFNKLAILAFYRRIFPIKQLRIVLLITTAVVICFTFTCLMIVVFQCVPIHTFWDVEERMIPGRSHCIDVDTLFLASGGVNCFLDFFITMMPLPLLWRLRTTGKQKLVLTSIFVVAGFVCLVSIIRLVVLSRLTSVDLTWNYVNAGIWTAVEPSMGVVSACLPSLRPLFKMIFSGTYKGPTFLSKTTGKSAQDYSSGTNFSKHMWSRHKDDGQDLSSFTRLEEQPINEPEPVWGHNVQVDGGGRSEDKISLDDMGSPSRQIRVKTEVTLISSQRLEYRDQLF